MITATNVILIHVMSFSAASVIVTSWSYIFSKLGFKIEKNQLGWMIWAAGQTFSVLIIFSYIFFLFFLKEGSSEVFSFF